MLLLVGVCLALLPLIILRDFTPSNELRYLSIADEALANHTFFAFTNHGVPYADKPPLYLWAVMLCRWFTGGHRMWLLSLFSLLPALGVVAVMERWAAKAGVPRGVPEPGNPLPPHYVGTAGLAALMLLTSAFFVGSAVTLRMDMLMCLFIVLAFREFWTMWSEFESASAVKSGADAGCGGEGNRFGNPRAARWLFPVFLFLALFTKGPYGLLIPLFGTAAFLLVCGRIRSFFRYWGWRTWLVLIVLCALWFSAVYFEGGSDYLDNLLFHQTVGRAVNSFHHKAPFYYYLISIWYSIAPWSLLVIGVIVAALVAWLRGRFRHLQTSDFNPLLKFFLTVALTTFVLLSCFSSKLQVYLLPAFPFFVYAGAMLLPSYGDNMWLRVALTVPAAVFALALPGILVAVFCAGLSFLNLWPVHIGCAVLTLTGVCSLVLLWGGKREDRVVSAVRITGIGMLASIFMIGWALPKVNPYLGYGQLCSEAMELSRESGIIDFRTWHVSRSESMDVYLHHEVTVITDQEPPSPEGDAPFLLMTKTDYLEHYRGLETRTVGPYAVVVCPGGSSADGSDDNDRQQ